MEDASFTRGARSRGVNAAPRNIRHAPYYYRHNVKENFNTTFAESSIVFLFPFSFAGTFYWKDKYSF